MESAPEIFDETPGQWTYESFEIIKGKQNYILNIKLSENNMILSISEKNFFLEVFQINLNLNEIKLLPVKLKKIYSCQELLNHIKIGIRNNSISISKINENKISFDVSGNFVFELNKQQNSFDLISKNIYELTSKLKKLEINYQNIFKENKDIKLNVEKIKLGNEMLTKKNNILSNDIILLKESLNSLKSSFSIEDFINVKKEVNRIIVENKDLKNDFKKMKISKELKEIIDNKINDLQKEIKKLIENKDNKIMNLQYEIKHIADKNAVLQNEIENLNIQNRSLKKEMSNLKQNKSIEIKIEGQKNIKEKNKSLEFIKTESNFREKVYNIKTFNNTKTNSTENLNNSFHKIQTRNYYSIDQPKKAPNSNKNTKNLNLKLTKNNSFNSFNIEKNNKLKEKCNSKNNSRPNSAYQNKYSHQVNKNNINLNSMIPKNLFNKEKNSINNYLENKKDNFIFNKINIAKKDDRNNIIKNHFNQNNRYQINNNSNNDKYNIPIFNSNKSQPPITQEQPKNIKKENEKK